MSTTPTAALVEEAEKMAVRALDGTASREEKSALFASLATALRRAIAERDELRATVTRLNRRAQTAEAGVRDNVEASKAAGKSMGRTLANAAAAMYRRRAEKAEAERDAQRAEVLRLTGERDELLESVEELRAQVWGLGCKVTNLRNALKRNEQQRRELGWRAASEEATMAEVVRLRFQSLHWFEENERHAKQMRDCLRQKFELTQENARLQKEVATLELLRRGGK